MELFADGGNEELEYGPVTDELPGMKLLHVVYIVSKTVNAFTE